jgi:hypothetical protein
VLNLFSRKIEHIISGIFVEFEALVFGERLLEDLFTTAGNASFGVAQSDTGSQKLDNFFCISCFVDAVDQKEYWSVVICQYAFKDSHRLWNLPVFYRVVLFGKLEI